MSIVLIVKPAGERRGITRLWLMWRDELIADGYSLPGPLNKALTARQLIWENELHEVIGCTPAQMADR